MGFLNRNQRDDLDPNAQEPKESFFFKLLRSKLFIPIVGVLVILIMVGILFNVMGGRQSGMSYYDTMMSIFTNELGSFSYTLAVQTGDRGTVIKENIILPEDILDGSDMEFNQGGSSYEFQDWDKYAEVKSENWEHPVFSVSIVGTTMSLDPLLTNFTISVATPYYNNKFTEVTVAEDTYYIDVESLYNWLTNSADQYLMSLATTIPHGSKWLEIPASEFAIPSRYAEIGDEESLSEVHSLVTLYRRFLVALQLAGNNISGSMGERGVDRREDVVYVNFVNDDAYALFNTVKGIFGSSGNFYDAYVNSGASSGLFDESQQKQAAREKDNMMYGLRDMLTALQLVDFNDMNMQASGQVRSYTNGYGNSQVEGVFGIQFSSADTDYIIKLNAMRSGDQRNIGVPEGSKVGTNADLYYNAFMSVIDYFNFTPIKTDVKLNINPDTISDAVLDNFVALVNSTGSAGKYITRNNVGEFIDKYLHMDEASAQEAYDIINIRLVADLVSALQDVVDLKVTPGVGQGGNTGGEDDPVGPGPDEVEQYPSVYWEVDGVEYVFHYNTEQSNYNLFVVDVEVINKSDEDVVVNATEFSMHDLLDSIYPANNETLIRGYDSTFDMSKLVGELTIPSHGWEPFKLYFVNVNSVGHTDLFNGSLKLGAIIQY